MNDDVRLSRSTREWLEDGPRRAPDHVVQQALFEIDSTPQIRRLVAPWRLRTMPAFGRPGLAGILIATFAGAVIALQVAGFVGGRTTTAIASPTASAPSPTLAATAAPSAPASVPAANLTTFFTSQRYGYTLPIAPTWSVQPATLTWTGPDNSGLVLDTVDTRSIDTPGLQIQAASQPIAPSGSFADWLTVFQPPQIAAAACFGGPASTWPVRQLGSYAWTWQTGCSAMTAITEVQGRAYVFTCIGCANPDGAALFDQILAGAQLNPAGAASMPRAPSLGLTFPSARFGFSVRYPGTWTIVRRATADAGPVHMPKPGDASVDALGDKTVQLSVISFAVPVGTTAEAWAATFCPLTATPWSQDCAAGSHAWEPVAIDRNSGWITVDGDSVGTYPTPDSRLFVATVLVGHRAYVVRLDGEAERSLFLALLSSMRLDPSGASTPAP